MSDPMHLAVLLLAIGGALGIGAWLDLARKRQTSGTPALRRMAAEMKLSRAEQRLVRKLSRAADVPPAGALISRGCFDYLVQTVPISSTDRQRAATLRDRLFA